MNILNTCIYSFFIGFILFANAYANNLQDNSNNINQYEKYNGQVKSAKQKDNYNITIYIKSKNELLTQVPAELTIIIPPIKNDDSTKSSPIQDKLKGKNITIIGKHYVSNGSVIYQTVPKGTNQIIFKSGDKQVIQEIFKDADFHQNIYIELMYELRNGKSELSELTSILEKSQ
ncbi:MAG: hypothetical protein ABSA86_01580 [Oryzomonas sp.]|jgi:hypothetical protein